MASVSQMALLAAMGASVAPNVVQRVASGSAARATSTVLTWAAATAGNLIVIEFVCETNAAAPTTPAGYTLWPSGNLLNGGTQTLGIFYKVAAGGETGVTIIHGSNTTCSIMREISATSGVIEFGTPTVATTLNPDPPSLTPGGGSKKYLWIAGADYPTTTASAYSSGYSNGLTGASTTNLYRVSSAEKTATGSVEDPGVLTLGSSVKCVAFTYVISPIG
ncbi:hypothetical protein [Mesorhizobium sp. M0859]|uniref:hypothetical protein n=1 Tax=Mesorhizobium sp. M0859 TaxID=2957014 RepID=UPI00333502A3